MFSGHVKWRYWTGIRSNFRKTIVEKLLGFWARVLLLIYFGCSQLKLTENICSSVQYLFPRQEFGSLKREAISWPRFPFFIERINRGTTWYFQTLATIQRAPLSTPRCYLHVLPLSFSLPQAATHAISHTPVSCHVSVTPLSCHMVMPGGVVGHCSTQVHKIASSQKCQLSIWVQLLIYCSSAWQLSGQQAAVCFHLPPYRIGIE